MAEIPKPDPNGKDYVNQLLSLCKLSEMTERNEDMCEYLKLLLTAKSGDLTDDERNLFSVGFKSVIGGLRRSWRGLQTDEDNKELTDKYKNFIKGQIDAVCDDVINLIEGTILPAEQSKTGGDDQEALKCAEAQTFYHKMVGDYQRYKAELRPGDTKVGQAATNAYDKAMAIAKPLADTDSTKLGLSLNYSVCLYEISKDRGKAIEIAKTAFDSALKKLDELSDKDYKSSTLIMQLLRDNLTLWSAETDKETTQPVED